MHRQVGKNHAALGHMRKAKLDDFVRGQRGNIPALVMNFARARFEETGNGAQGGRLARAIGPDQGDDVTLFNLQREVPQGGDRAVIHAQIAHR